MSMQSLVRRKRKTDIRPIAPSERDAEKKYERSLLEEILGKMERTQATVTETTKDDHGKETVTTSPMSQSASLAKDIMLAITPSLRLGVKAPLIKENIFGLQDLAMLASLTELYNGPDDPSTKGMNLLLQNVTMSMFPRSMTEDLRKVNIIEKDDPETKLMMRYFLGKEFNMPIAAQLKNQEEEQ